MKAELKAQMEELKKEKQHLTHMHQPTCIVRAPNGGLLRVRETTGKLTSCTSRIPTAEKRQGGMAHGSSAGSSSFGPERQHPLL